jgi:hypothetical protein
MQVGRLPQLIKDFCGWCLMPDWTENIMSCSLLAEECVHIKLSQWYSYIRRSLVELLQDDAIFLRIFCIQCWLSRFHLFPDMLAQQWTKAQKAFVWVCLDCNWSNSSVLKALSAFQSLYKVVLDLWSDMLAKELFRELKAQGNNR